MPKTDMPIKFAKTRHHYDSYGDFWDLVELARFETCYTDEIKMDDYCIYITAPMNGDTRAHLTNHIHEERNAHIILWLLERPGSEDGGVPNFGRVNRQLIVDRLIDEVWVSDRKLAEETSLRYVTLGSNYGLGEPGDGKVFDFCHMSYITPRRTTIYKHFMNIGPNSWGEERHNVLQKSYFAVNVHQDQFPFCEPLRIALFAAYGLPIISESIHDSHPYGDGLISAPYDDLPDQIKICLKGNVKKYRDHGLAFRQKMCEEFEFGKMVEEAIYVNGLHWR